MRLVIFVFVAAVFVALTVEGRSISKLMRANVFESTANPMCSTVEDCFEAGGVICDMKMQLQGTGKGIKQVDGPWFHQLSYGFCIPPKTHTGCAWAKSCEDYMESVSVAEQKKLLEHALKKDGSLSGESQGCVVDKSELFNAQEQPLVDSTVKPSPDGLGVLETFSLRKSKCEYACKGDGALFCPYKEKSMRCMKRLPGIRWATDKTGAKTHVKFQFENKAGHGVMWHMQKGDALSFEKPNVCAPKPEELAVTGPPQEITCPVKPPPTARHVVPCAAVVQLAKKDNGDAKREKEEQTRKSKLQIEALKFMDSMVKAKQKLNCSKEVKDYIANIAKNDFDPAELEKRRPHFAPACASIVIPAKK